MDFVKELGVFVLLSTVFHMGQIHQLLKCTQETELIQKELQNEEDEDDLSKYGETGIGSPTSAEEIREAHSLKEQTTNRHEKVEEGLKHRRDKKLLSKLNMDTQLLNISKEELSLKRKLVEHQQNLKKSLIRV